MSSDTPANGQHVNLSDSAIALTDLGEHQNPPTVSVRKVTQSEIANMTNIQQVNESKLKDDENPCNDSINRPSTVSVIRVKRMPSLNSNSEGNLNTTRFKSARAASKRIRQVTITRILRKISSRNQRSHSAIFIDANRSSVVNNNEGVTMTQVSKTIIDT